MHRLLFFTFITVFLSGPLSLNGKTLRIATFNIRYDNKKDRENQWKNRREAVCEFLGRNHLDVICLQEVVKNQCDDLASSLSGYSFVFMGRNDCKDKGLAVPIFYRSNKFICLESGCFWLSESPDSIGSIGWDADQTRNLTWVKLQNKKDGQCLYVFNTHLDHKGKVAREESMKLIKYRMDEIANGYPSILTGDMNSSTSSNVLEIVKENRVPMNDSYEETKKHKGVSYTFHGFGNTPIDKRRRIDYLFVSQQITVDEVTIPREKDEQGVFLSDHCPVVVKLKIK